MSLIVGLAIGLAVFLFMEGLYRYRASPTIKVKLAQISMIGEEERSVRKSYFERRIRPLATLLAPRFTFLQPLIQPRNTEAKLAYAGYPRGLDLEQLLGIQVLSGIAFFFLGLIAGLPRGPLVGTAMVLIFIVGGLLAPILWLDSRAKERQRAITRSVPETLEILSICVQAGLNFDAALRHLVRGLEGPLAEELEEFLHELQMGVPRKEAFDRLMQRNSSEELKTVIGAISQSQELGVPIVKTLKEQAEEMRTRRLQRGKEEGARASPKISLVTTLLVAPSSMCLMIAVLLFYILAESGGPLTGIFGGP